MLLKAGFETIFIIAQNLSIKNFTLKIPALSKYVWSIKNAKLKLKC